MLDWNGYTKELLSRVADLGKLSPEIVRGYRQLTDAGKAKNVLGAKTRELIALAVAHTVQCPYCIDAYSTASLEKGATPEQMTEAVHVAAAIRGGASLVHGVQMRNQIDKLSM